MCSPDHKEDLDKAPSELGLIEKLCGLTTRAMASYDKQTKQLIVLETNEWDVFLGRGKNTYFRPGNVYFRQLVDENVLEYERCGNGGSKTDIARKLISHIRSKGGRFVRQVPATNAQGQVVGALEIVGEDIVLAKAKQAMRDAAKSRREKKKATTAALPQHDCECKTFVN